MALTERAIADFLTLLFLKLTNYNLPDKGGDPEILQADQMAELAAAGIRMLTLQLPQETAQKIEAALEKFPRGQQADVEEKLVNAGSLGGVLHRGASGPPGCCVMQNGRLICARTGL